MLNSPYLITLLGVTFGISIINTVILVRGSLEIKSRWHFRLMAMIGVCFIGLAYLQVPTGQTLLFSIPFVIILTFFYHRASAFCPECGALNHNPIAIIRGEFSCKCGNRFAR